MREPVGRVDPRVARSRERVLFAAVELLRDEGRAGLTVEAVAARSGVAKTTIYRQFADRDEIHMAAIEASTTTLEPPVTDDVVADVERGLRQLVAKLRDDEFSSLLSTVIEAAERSEGMARLSASSCESRRGWLIDRLTLALARGEITSGHPEVMGSQLAGPLFFRRFISRQPLPDSFVREVVDTVITPKLAAPTAARRRSPSASSGGGSLRSTG